MGLSKEDPLFNRKKEYLDKSGRGVSNVRFPLQANRYPSELVDFLRLLLVEPEDLGRRYFLSLLPIQLLFSHYFFVYFLPFICRRSRRYAASRQNRF